MRVLWVCNIILPIIAERMQQEYSVREGWLTGTLNRLIASEDKSDITLGICFPVSSQLADYHEIHTFSSFQVECFGFEEDLTKPEIYDQKLEKQFALIINQFKPDLVHVFGTEFPHALAVATAFHNKERLLIGIQGVISECAKSYFADLPQKVIKSKTLRDWIKKDNIIDQQKKFYIRGMNEKKALLLAGNVTGRTEFDKIKAQEINNKARYFSMNETMRSVFYTDKWELEYCRKHRIFVSQADYPLKGFHYLLQALPKIMIRYPDTEIVVAGNSIVNYKTIKDMIKIGGYGKYLRSYINEWELNPKIAFLGKLSAEEMKEQFLLCQTYICASALENSPNSVGEAMLLGVPVVASNTGGILSMITNREDGILFQKGNHEELANCIIELWNNDELCNKLSQNARKRAQSTHNPDSNYVRLLEIYHQIMGNCDKQ